MCTGGKQTPQVNSVKCLMLNYDHYKSEAKNTAGVKVFKILMISVM